MRAIASSDLAVASNSVNFKSMSIEDFSRLTLGLLQEGKGYIQLSELFQLRAGPGLSLARVACEVISRDRPIYDSGETYWPLTEYILHVLNNIPREDILRECAAGSGVSLTVLSARFEALGLDVKRYAGVVNSVTNSSFVQSTARLEEDAPYAKMPRWLVKSGNPGLVARQRRKTHVAGLVEVLDPDFKSSDAIDRAVAASFVDVAVTENSQVSDEVDLHLVDDADVKNSEARTDIQRLYGPLHSVNDRCAAGVGDGHRMLRCTCFETAGDLPIDPNPRSWYTGKCQSCGLKLRRAAHALRFPLKTNGFKGCYCSFECMERHPAEDPSDIGKFNVGELYSQLHAFGVYW